MSLIYKALRDLQKQDVLSVRIDALPRLCGTTALAIEAELSRLMRRKEVIRIGGRVSLADIELNAPNPEKHDGRACKRCNTFKLLSDFRGRGTGHLSICRDCEADLKEAPVKAKRVKCYICERDFLRPLTETTRRCNACEVEFADVRQRLAGRPPKAGA